MNGSYASKITSTGGNTGCSCPRMKFEDGFSYRSGRDVWIRGSWYIPNPSALTWSRMMNLSSYTGGAGDYYTGLVIENGSGQMLVRSRNYSSGTGEKLIFPARPIPVGRWFTVALHFKLSPVDGQALNEWYVDGKLVGSSTVANMVNDQALEHLPGRHAVLPQRDQHVGVLRQPRSEGLTGREASPPTTGGGASRTHVATAACHARPVLDPAGGGPGARARALGPVIGSCAAWLGALLLYVVTVGTALGQDIEEAVPVRVAGAARTAADAVLATVSTWTLLAVGIGTVVVLVRRGRSRAAVGVALLLAGTNAAALVLSRALGRLSPLGGEAQRSLGEGFFPSGHAVAALSMACAVVAAVPPRYGARAWWLGGAYGAVVGVALLAPGSHYASDVLGGILLVVGWVVLLRSTWTDGALPTPLRTGALSVVAALAGVLLTSVVVGVRPDEEPALAVAVALATGGAFGAARVTAGAPVRVSASRHGGEPAHRRRGPAGAPPRRRP